MTCRCGKKPVTLHARSMVPMTSLQTRRFAINLPSSEAEGYGHFPDLYGEDPVQFLY